MIATIKALSALLRYPDEMLKALAPNLAGAMLEEGLLSGAGIGSLTPLLKELAEDDLLDLQERFVFLFDRSRSLSLNLFEHVHGESRERGAAMVDLLETYRAAGFEPAGAELPDHLPMLLEYLAHRPLEEARETLADAAQILTSLADKLDRRGSGYAPVLRALVELAAAQAASERPAGLAAAPDDDPDDLAALDAVWEEAAVVFGPDPNAGCPVSRELLSRIQAPPPGAAARAR